MENDVIYINFEKIMLTVNGRVNLTFKTEIKTGELVALFGSSGAGKTTILRILAGLVKPDKGLIKFGDLVWYDSEKHINISTQQRNISLMFQDYALFPNMTVEQNILYSQPQMDHTEADHLISVFDLVKFRKLKILNLSGGQKQRVALARALARKPQLLLLDEPLSALDSEMRSLLQDEISQAHQLSGGTTILVSHDLNEVYRLATNVIYIENGKISKSGIPDEIFFNAKAFNQIIIKLN